MEDLFALLLVGLVGIIVTCAITVTSDDKTSKVIFSILSCILSIVCGWLIIFISEYNKPTAIDVYRDKTTLEITYKDSIPVDTVVVFK